MLELKNITKDYPAGDNTVHALKGVSLKFRTSEFVSILGQSGCGKTTMLNIIGGLDHYTSGDLVINGVSTKNYKDRDWDSYRNHSVGFVFQSYNLIPHQTVLQNVEIALTLSGVSKAERRRRAKEALISVGLGDQLNKKPSEMSGGQMQRVAIARAIVNNPDIILADEPTGALDSETSLQVMDILKDIAKDRLVIMVTHNPEIAEKYSTRIIRMLDGVITDDSNPLNEDENEKEHGLEKERNTNKVKKPSMSIFTAFGLSLKNLFTKKGRTTLTSFAGSIGIIGIALIYAVSQGLTLYIDRVQEDTLSSYPLTLEAQHVNIGELMQVFIDSAATTEHENDGVYQKPAMYNLVKAYQSLLNAQKENDLGSFKEFIETEREKDGSDAQNSISGIQYSYNLNMLIYTENVDGKIIQSDAQKLIGSMLVKHLGSEMAGMLGMAESNPMSSMMSTGMSTWQEMLPGDKGALINDTVKDQYDLVYGNWPAAYNQVVVVLDKNNEIDDMTLYALGLKTESEIDEIFEAAIDQKPLGELSAKKWSYEEICGRKYKTIFASDCFVKDENGVYTDLRETDAGLKMLYKDATELEVVGIIRPSEDAVSGMISGSIAYTSELTKYVIENSKLSAAIKDQQENKDKDIFTGLPFRPDDDVSVESKANGFNAYIAQLDTKGKADAYVKIMCIAPDDIVNAQVDAALSKMTREDMENTLITALTQQMGMSEAQLREYISVMEDEELKDIFAEMIEEQVRAGYAQQVKAQLAAMTDEQLAGALDMAMTGNEMMNITAYTAEQRAKFYEEVLEFSESTYEMNLARLGYVDINKPSSINLYAATFEDKDVIEEIIAAYNEGKEETAKITYTDYVGLMMSSITTIINAITYVLIGFVSVSLIVSSIMIGVITLISVQERTKEIGILRAIGASKRNVSSMFNAETVIIGFTSGAFGVIFTYLICIPLNMILNALTGIESLDAVLPIGVALVLVGISIVLNLISGIIPSRSAAKKDPVVALRTE